MCWKEWQWLHLNSILAHLAPFSMSQPWIVICYLLLIASDQKGLRFFQSVWPAGPCWSRLEFYLSFFRIDKQRIELNVKLQSNKWNFFVKRTSITFVLFAASKTSLKKREFFSISHVFWQNKYINKYDFKMCSQVWQVLLHPRSGQRSSTA